MANTPNLNILLIDKSQPLLSKQFNDALGIIDTNALPRSHAESSMHWPMWKSGNAYKKADVFRTEGMPSWGYWEVLNAGTSGSTKPVGYGAGDLFQDGGCQVVLRRLTTPDTIPEESLWQYFVANKSYYVGDVFRTPTTPSWGYWEVTIGGQAGTHVPSKTVESDVETTGGVTCVLKRISSGEKIESHRLWEDFKPNHAYGVGDIFRTPTTPSWGYWKVTKAGTSGTAIPKSTTEGAVFNLGTGTCSLIRIGAQTNNNTTTTITVTPSTSTLWELNKEYVKGDFVSYNEDIYLCLVAHTSSSSFTRDLGKGYWKRENTDITVVGSDGGYSQIQKKITKAKTTVTIDINDTEHFCLPPIEVLRTRDGATNQTVKEMSFDVSDEASFVPNPNFVFDETGLHLQTYFNVPMPSSTVFENGQLSESALIDFSNYKLVEEVKPVWRF